jgi:alpha-tubulin suppressor-like RCC1 family protein
MRDRRPVTVTALMLLATLCACAGGVSAQTGPVLTIDVSARGLFDSNIDRSAVPLGAYGGGGDLLLRAANRSRAPTLQLEYTASLRHSSPAQPADGPGQRLNVRARVQFADWIRMDMIGRASRGGTDEDLATGDELLLSSRVEVEPARATRVRPYAAYRWRRTSAAEPLSVGAYAGLELRQRIGWGATLMTDARYEAFQPPDRVRDWQRLAVLVGVGHSLSRNTAIEAEARFRVRDHPRRLVELNDDVAARRDLDHRYGVAFVYDNGSSTEIRLELERDRRRSNAVGRGYDADRVGLTVRQRIFGLGARQNLPRIFEGPADDALRRPVAAIPSFSGVRVAGSALCGLREDGALCWPPPTATETAATPALVTGRWQRVSAADGRACALDATGHAHCWQWRRTLGGPPELHARPQLVHSELRFQEIAVGFNHACALTDDGVAYCWGENGEGQLGTGLATPASKPVAVLDGLRFRAIAVGMNHTCALAADGTAYCWGANESGQAGAGGVRRILRPRGIDAPRFTAITAGARHTCALTDAGEAYCWGESARGQAGAAGGTVAARPFRIDTNIAFTMISAGWAHTCALTAAGRAYCWGSNRYGQLGTGNTDMEPHPAPVAVTGGLTFADLSASFRTCALDVAGQVHCWGGSGQDAASDAAAARPRAVPSVPR